MGLDVPIYRLHSRLKEVPYLDVLACQRSHLRNFGSFVVLDHQFDCEIPKEAILFLFAIHLGRLHPHRESQILLLRSTRSKR
jgi:hypothetical protein